MNLRKTLLYFLSFPVFWLAFFLIFRISFLFYHHKIFSAFSLGQCLQSVGNGMKMDLSVAGYISIFPFIWFLFHDVVSPKRWIKVLSWYQLILVFVFGFILTADLEIFQNWGHRMDSAIVPYLRFPKEAFASSWSSPIRILFTIFGLSFVVSGMCWAAFHLPLLRALPPKTGPIRWISLAFLTVLILPIRGGFQLAPMNQSAVHFSSNIRLNQSAENGIWVLIQSLLEMGDEAGFQQEYIRFSIEEVKAFQHHLYPSNSNAATDSVFNQNRPNVVIIVWESLTANVVGCLGGVVPSTPNLDQVAKDGILFSNFYASGDRSDKGLASILSGFPALGKISVMMRPAVVARLPFLTKELNANGYLSAFLYGGELEFANMKSYLIEAGFGQLISKSDFAPEMYNSKWGAHDEVVFARQLELAKVARQPFFQTLFTLSSHEPFEVPGVKIKESDPVDSLFCQAHRYTDRCLGSWIAEARKQDWWANTLVVIVADHGHPRPVNLSAFSSEKYRIPMVWTGGALNTKGLEVKTIGNQTDIAATILAQLGLPSAKFTFSNNLLDPARKGGFAYYAWHDGAAWVDGTGQYQLEKEASPSSQGLRNAGLYQQMVYGFHSK